MPPPDWPKSAWFFVKRSRFSAGKRLDQHRDDDEAEHGDRERGREEREQLHRTVQAFAPADAAAREQARRGRSLAQISLEALDDHLRGDVHRQREHEQDQCEVDQRRGEVRERALVLGGDPARERVAEREEREVVPVLSRSPG